MILLKVTIHFYGCQEFKLMKYKSKLLIIKSLILVKTFLQWQTCVSSTVLSLQDRRA